MATQAMLYGVAGSNATNPAPYKLKRTSTTPLPHPTLVKAVAPLKAQGVIDFLEVIGDGIYPSAAFIQDCQANGVTCGINNSNDGTSSNWSLAYYQALANSGVQWGIGESESGAEQCARMSAAPGKFVAGTYGGEGTGGPVNGNNDIWSGNALTPNCTIKPGTINFWAETYTSNSMIAAADIATAAGINKDHGTFEQGLLIGSWAQNDYGAGAETYIEMVDAMASHGVPCAGFQWWYDQGGFSFPSIFSDLMKTYPANMTPILKRAGGVSPPPKPTIEFVTVPTKASDGSLLAIGTDKATWRSTDTGKTWASLGGVCISDLAVDSKNVYVIGTTEALYYKPINGSADWKSLGGICKSAPKVVGTAIQVVGSTGAIYQRTLTTGWVDVYPKIQ